MTSAILTNRSDKNGRMLPLPNPIGNGGNILPPNLIRNGRMSPNPYKRFLAKPPRAGVGSCAKDANDPHTRTAQMANVRKGVTK